jgi:restriction system protein
MARRSKRKSRFTAKGYAVLFLAVMVILLASSYPDLLKAGILLGGGLVVLNSVWKRHHVHGKAVGSNAGLHELLALSPSEFEEFTRGLLMDHGYRNLRVIGGSGDLGVDILGRDSDGRSTAVQCKRLSPSQRIGSPMIQTFIGMQKIHHRADRGILVTTADFTQAAKKLAADHDIWLIDGSGLVRLHRKRRTGSGSKRWWSR